VSAKIDSRALMPMWQVTRDGVSALRIPFPVPPDRHVIFRFNPGGRSIRRLITESGESRRFLILPIFPRSIAVSPMLLSLLFAPCLERFHESFWTVLASFWTVFRTLSRVDRVSTFCSIAACTSHPQGLAAGSVQARALACPPRRNRPSHMHRLSYRTIYQVRRVPLAVCSCAPRRVICNANERTDPCHAMPCHDPVLVQMFSRLLPLPKPSPCP
jgi:hypothetical protein